jgi:predicted transposase YbfD/YdcC
MGLRELLERVPDPRGLQGRDYALWSILALMVVSLLNGRKGMNAAFELGRSLTRRERAKLGFSGRTPCHATLTETLRVIDPMALAHVLGTGLAPPAADEAGQRHVAIDGKTMRASKNSDGQAVHIVSAFCAHLQTTLQHEASRGKGFEIPDALKLLDQIELDGVIVTGDALFCQRSIIDKIVTRGGDFVLPVKDNQKDLRENIETAFNEPVSPLSSHETVEKAHGRIEIRRIDVLPAEAADIGATWPLVAQVCRVTRIRQTLRNGQWHETSETAWLITSLAAHDATPARLLEINRDHWGIEVMHRHKDFTLREDGYTNRCDHAPRNVSSILAFALGILKTVSHSPTRAIEHFQNRRSRSLNLVERFH